MPKVLLDTDTLSEYLKGHDKDVARRAANYASQHGAFTFTSVTVHEIVFGAGDYQEAAIIRASARKQGAILELPDCLIAAVAIRLGLPVVTGNTEDFQAIQKTGAKLVIDNWRGS